MDGQAHDAGKTSFAPLARTSIKYVSEEQRDHFTSLVRRVQAEVEVQFGVNRLFHAGSLLMRIWAPSLIPPGLLDRDAFHEYWVQHSDKESRSSYDFSALNANRTQDWLAPFD